MGDKSVYLPGLVNNPHRHLLGIAFVMKIGVRLISSGTFWGLPGMQQGFPLPWAQTEVKAVKLCHPGDQVTDREHLAEVVNATETFVSKYNTKSFSFYRLADLIR